MQNNFEKKVYNLFGNDKIDSQTFIKNISHNDKVKFVLIYPQLLKVYKNTLADPYEVLATTEKMVENLESTGNAKTSSASNDKLIQKIENVKNFIQDKHDEQQVSTTSGNELTNILNGILTYEDAYATLRGDDKSKWNSVRRNISKNINDLLDVMIKNSDDQTKMKEMLEVMKKIKKQILFIANDISPNEKKTIEKEATENKARETRETREKEKEDKPKKENSKKEAKEYEETKSEPKKETKKETKARMKVEEEAMQIRENARTETKQKEKEKINKNEEYNQKKKEVIQKYNKKVISVGNNRTYDNAKKEQEKTKALNDYNKTISKIEKDYAQLL
jgi:hypothetical protein